MKKERDKRYTAFLALAVILILAFIIYNHGHVAEPWSRPPAGDVEPFPGFPVDINRANVPTLMILPGVGPKMAEAIIAERKKRGGFSSINDIGKVRGIGKEKLKALKDFIIIKKAVKKGKLMG